jgi:hypothetical protein
MEKLIENIWAVHHGTLAFHEGNLDSNPEKFASAIQHGFALGVGIHLEV